MEDLPSQRKKKREGDEDLGVKSMERDSVGVRREALLL